MKTLKLHKEKIKLLLYDDRYIISLDNENIFTIDNKTFRVINHYFYLNARFYDVKLIGDMYIINRN